MSKTNLMWLIDAMLFIALIAMRAGYITVETFEDGSGRITYCLPGAICND